MSTNYEEVNEWETTSNFQLVNFHLFFAFFVAAMCFVELFMTQHFFFRENWLKLIEKNQKDLILVVTVSKNKNWFEYIKNKQQPGLSRYRCRICFKYYDEMKE